MYSVKDLSHLPETGGVYIFYDSEKRLVHIGEGSNLYKRISKHVRGKYRSTRDIYERFSFYWFVPEDSRPSRIALKEKLVDERA